MNKAALYFLTIALFSCTNKGEDLPLSDIDTLALAKHIEILASDEFQGRRPFTLGEEKTVKYITDNFKKLGLKPGNGESYYQEVPLVELDAKPADRLIIEGNGNEMALNFGPDFITVTERVEEEVKLESSDLVFAGFGIVAPEYGWNDYEGLDVKGKTVIVLVNDPGFGSGDSTLFKGETMTYYGRWTYKYEEATRQGAAGVLIVHETAPASYPWMVVRTSWSGASLYLDNPQDQFQPIIQGWITRDAAIRIFEASDVDLRNFVERSRRKGFKPIDLGLKISGSIKNGIKKNTSKNVIAKIEGVTRPDEVIVYTAHWDHFGIGNPIDGDSIYNGAHDNASGIAGLLEIAREFKKAKERPDRTVVFLAVTAEEQGLLGAKYYAENPIYPPEKTVANINMDALNYVGLMKDLTVYGFGQSELEDIAAEIASRQGRYIYPDPTPGAGSFFRSDHFQFAKIGIPSIFASGTYEAVNGGVEYAKKVREDYNANAYHMPADEFVRGETEWKLGGMLQDVELYYLLGEKLANSEVWPKWKEGSEFKLIRERD